MISSVTPDEHWLSLFDTLPSWNEPDTPLIVVAPHPDDETLGAGALLATLARRGVPITIVAVTDGENAYDRPPAERVALAHLREREQASALTKLGISPRCIHRLRLTDSGLAEQELSIERELSKLCSAGMTVLAPWEGDFHPDHISCARAAKLVTARLGLRLISYFFWTWHRGTPTTLEGLRLTRFAPDARALHAKAEALLCHASQLHWSHGDPILPDHLLGPSRWPLEVFALHD